MLRLRAQRYLALCAMRFAIASVFAGAHLPHPHERVRAGRDESFALDGKTHVQHSTAVATFAVTDFLNDVVRGALMQQDYTLGGAAGAWV